MNNIRTFITSRETFAFRFFPTNEFYTYIGISGKRFGQYLRNEKQPTIEELKIISEWLKCSLEELIND